ncbi:hypothetical protein ACFSCZ_10795 [Siminovitchia sediminis]|uniref:Uncharacterized protein n=1 Tax=Siminovitchia sediminis TaxID=1274353 RepID=A0ABW4KG78_9BACI
MAEQMPYKCLRLKELHGFFQVPDGRHLTGAVVRQPHSFTTGIILKEI